MAPSSIFSNLKLIDNTAHCRCKGNDAAKYFNKVFVDRSGKICRAFQELKMAIPFFKLNMISRLNAENCEIFPKRTEPMISLIA